MGFNSGFKGLKTNGRTVPLHARKEKKEEKGGTVPFIINMAIGQLHASAV